MHRSNSSNLHSAQPLDQLNNSQLEKQEFYYVFAINTLINLQNFVVDELYLHIYLLNVIQCRIHYYIYHKTLGVNITSYRTKHGTTAQNATAVPCLLQSIVRKRIFFIYATGRENTSKSD